MTPRRSLLELDRDQLAELMAAAGQPAYRADQIWHWLYDRQVTSIAAMTNLPRVLRESLSEAWTVGAARPVVELDSSDGETTKALLQLADGQTVEAVLMRYEKRRTVCISTQAGCAMGCVFCATGQMGFFRHLTAGEIVEQVLFFARQLGERGERVTNVVFMGMGEPLHNYEHTIEALDRLTDSEGFGLGARRVTISTVGLVPAIRRYAEEERQTPLAVSLHAATDEERDALIPVNRRWPLAELMAACRYYVERTGRRLTIEWALINGSNDSVEEAATLGELLRGLLCHVNLIPLNPTADYGGRPSPPDRVAAFQATLAAAGISSTVRVRRGLDIQAGCGQLRTAAGHTGPATSPETGG